MFNNFTPNGNFTAPSKIIQGSQLDMEFINKIVSLYIEIDGISNTSWVTMPILGKKTFFLI